MIYFVQKLGLCFLFKLCLNMWVFRYLLQTVAKACVSMVTNQTGKFKQNSLQVRGSRSDVLSGTSK